MTFFKLIFIIVIKLPSYDRISDRNTFPYYLNKIYFAPSLFKAKDPYYSQKMLPRLRSFVKHYSNLNAMYEFFLTKAEKPNLLLIFPVYGDVPQYSQLALKEKVLTYCTLLNIIFETSYAQTFTY